MKHLKTLRLSKKIVLTAAFVLATGSSFVHPSTASAAQCVTNPPTTYGQVTQAVSVASAGTYSVWSRIKAPSTTANSYYFQVDAGCAVNVGDSTSIPVNTWTWVNYQDGDTSSLTTVNLTAGNHTLTYTGKEADVQLDRVLFLGDASCVPTGTGDNCAVADKTSPQTSITAPADGSSAVIGSTVNITATATDNVAVKKVEFYADGALLGVDDTRPYAYSWNTSAASKGNHSLTTRAYDTSDNTATSTPAVSITLTQPPDTEDPTVSITAPINGSSFVSGSNVTIKADADDNVGVTKVEFYQNGTLIGTDNTPPKPFTVNWDTTGKAAGSYSLTAKAYDAAGHNKVSTAVTVTLTQPVDGTPPTVSITAPANGSSASIGSTVSIKADADDNVAVTKVEFYQNGTLIGTDNTPPKPFTMDWNTTGKAAGTYSLTAKAYDAAGNNKLSNPVSITLTDDSGKVPGDCSSETEGPGKTDGRVNALDLSLVLTKDGTDYPPCDFNKVPPSNGVIDGADTSVLYGHWTW